MLLMVCRRAYGLIAAVRRSRLETVLTAGPAGLRFVGAPRGVQDGFIERAAIGQMSVSVVRIHLSGRSYALRVTRNDNDKAFTLMLGADKGKLERVRDALARAMGVT